MLVEWIEKGIMYCEGDEYEDESADGLLVADEDLN